MQGSWLGLVIFLAVAVGIAAVMLWPRFRESLSPEPPVVVEALAALRQVLATEEGVASRAAALASVADLRANRSEWHERLREEGVDQGVHDALDRV